MTGRTVKSLIIITASAVLPALLGLCIYGTIHASDIDRILCFAQCIARSMVFFIFLVFFYKSLFSGSGLDTALMPLFLLFSMILEFRIISDFAAVTIIMPVSPVILSRVLAFSLLMSGFSLFGFGFFYQNREPSAVTAYILLSAAFSLIMVLVTPTTQKIDLPGMNTYFSVFISALYTASAILFLRQIILDPPGSYLIRHFSALLFLAGNVINIYFDGRILNLVGTAFTVLSYSTVMLVSKVRDVKY